MKNIRSTQVIKPFWKGHRDNPIKFEFKNVNSIFVVKQMSQLNGKIHRI